MAQYIWSAPTTGIDRLFTDGVYKVLLSIPDCRSLIAFIRTNHRHNSSARHLAKANKQFRRRYNKCLSVSIIERFQEVVAKHAPDMNVPQRIAKRFVENTINFFEASGLDLTRKTVLDYHHRRLLNEVRNWNADVGSKEKVPFQSPQEIHFILMWLLDNDLLEWN